MKEELKLLKELSDETRFNILRLLASGEKCVCQIFPFVKKTQSTVSIHLNNLEKSGIVKSRREGKWIYYKIVNKKVLDIFDTLGVKPIK
jgi:ArsR family transcriptional regulator